MKLHQWYRWRKELVITKLTMAFYEEIYPRDTISISQQVYSRGKFTKWTYQKRRFFRWLFRRNYWAEEYKKTLKTWNLI